VSWGRLVWCRGGWGRGDKGSRLGQGRGEGKRYWVEKPGKGNGWRPDRSQNSKPPYRRMDIRIRSRGRKKGWRAKKEVRGGPQGKCLALRGVMKESEKKDC